MMRAAAMLAVSLVPATSPSAIAAERSCDTLAALTGQDRRGTEDLSLHFASDGTLALRHNGRTTLMAGASACEISAPAAGFEISCSWDYETLAEADGRFALLRQTIERCVPQRFVDRTYPSSVEGLVVHRSFSLAIEPDESGEFEGSDVDLRIYEFQRAGIPGRFSLGLTFAQ